MHKFLRKLGIYFSVKSMEKVFNTESYTDDDNKPLKAAGKFTSVCIGRQLLQQR